MATQDITVAKWFEIGLLVTSALDKYGFDWHCRHLNALYAPML